MDCEIMNGLAGLPQDPAMLMSMVNMWLRDSGDTLDELCASRGIDRAALTSHLAAAGFDYDPSVNRFR